MLVRSWSSRKGLRIFPGLTIIILLCFINLWVVILKILIQAVNYVVSQVRFFTRRVNHSCTHIFTVIVTKIRYKNKCTSNQLHFVIKVLFEYIPVTGCENPRRANDGTTASPAEQYCGRELLVHRLWFIFILNYLYFIIICIKN